MSGDREAVWASLLVAAALSGVVGGGLGVVAAIVVVEVLQARRVGCFLTRIDGQGSWSCPDGIAYVVPVLATVSVIWMIAMLFFVYREFRGAGAESPFRAATISSTVAAVPLIIQVAATVPAGVAGGVDPGLVSLGTVMCVAGIAVLIFRRRSRTGFVVSCAVSAVSALVVAPSVVLLAPVLVAVAGALVAAIVLTVTGTRSGDPLPH
ncbi:hypothetical protein [Rhodococcus sp. As11]|uniref:hypothetical protein n=1 Tax=Rhodococcus sp. As11 TaxID=3029189 RepID=UPI003B77A8B7